jgi:sterol desaturase/sphingolipid hydroxylase (fatty acid hydroxylase superfamily)
MILEFTVIAIATRWSAIQRLWLAIYQRTTDFQMTVGGLFAALVLGYFLGCIPYLMLDLVRPSSARAAKVQKQWYPDARALSRCFLSLFFLFFGVMLPLIAFSYPVFRWVGVRREPPLPRADEVVLHVLTCFVIEDFGNYWIHRWLHTPWLYRHIHYWHHQWNTPFSLAATDAHPLEVILLGIPTIAGPVLLSSHLLTTLVWMMLRQYEAIDIHSGYEFRWNLNAYLPFYGGTEHHDYHHYLYSGNYASIFTYCDEVYGTNLAYKQRKQVKSR